MTDFLNQLIKEYLNNGYHLLYIGKKNHPETEAVLSFSSDITLVTDDNFDEWYNEVTNDINEFIK